MTIAERQAARACSNHARAGCPEPTLEDPMNHQPDPTDTEPDNPAAWALARHIADHPVSTIQAAFRYLNAPLTIELHEDVSAGVAPAPDQTAPCRTTQHCAHHGWCRRCAPDFAAAMSRVNVAIQRTEPDESHWGPLYEAVGKALREVPAAVLPASVDRADVLRWAADEPAPVDRAALSAKLWEIAEQHIVAEWICCEPLEPQHTLCAKGYAALGMAKTLLVDSPEAWNPEAPLLNAVLAELRRVAAETPNTTGHACSNCEGIDPDTCLMNPDRPRDKTTLMRAHVALAGQAGHDQAALARVRQLHDRLAEETDLTSPDDEITRGKAAKLIATALDGWNPDGAPQCPVEFENSARCAKPAGHRPPGSDDPHVPTAAPPAGGAPQPKEA